MGELESVKTEVDENAMHIKILREHVQYGRRIAVNGFLLTIEIKRQVETASSTERQDRTKSVGEESSSEKNEG